MYPNSQVTNLVSVLTMTHVCVAFMFSADSCRMVFRDLSVGSSFFLDRVDFYSLSLPSRNLRFVLTV